jgi:hypothetical protein
MNEIRTDFSKFVFRAHMVGKLLSGLPSPLSSKQEERLLELSARKDGYGKPLTENMLSEWGILYARTKEKPKLSDGTKKLLKEMVFSEMFGRRKTIESKMITKGQIREEDGITLHSNVTGSLYVKNKERRSNDWFSGECDINTKSGTIDDIKLSWSIDTFPAIDECLTSSDYRPQGMCYMDLWGKHKYRVAYCLVNTPDFLIERELRGLYYTLGCFDLNGEMDIRPEHVDDVVDLVSKHIYTQKGLEEFIHTQALIKLDWFSDFVEIPESFRVKLFQFDRDEKEISDIKIMISLSREFMCVEAEKMAANGLELVMV